MPRGHLDERYVQGVAVAWLADHYNAQLSPKAVVPTTEARIRKASKYGNGRADGLIAALLDDDTVYTISLEAKSHRTWNDIRIQNADVKWILHALGAGALFLLLGVYLGNLLGGGWFLGLCIPSIFLIAGAAAFMTLTYSSSRYQVIYVINQVKRYPANERWIALSADALNRIRREKQYSDFESICNRDGIGLLKVGANKQVIPVIHPKKQITPKQLGCFLECYAKETQIRKEFSRIQSIGIVVDEPIDLGDDGTEIVSERNLQLEQSEPQ